MNGKTHRLGGMVCVLGGYSYMKHKGMLLDNVEPLIQLTIMYPFALWGSTFCDLDQNSNASPSKDIISTGINRILHLTTKLRDKIGEDKPYSKVLSVFDAKHRSWQTHSDLFLCLVIYLLWRVQTFGSGVNEVILELILTGFTLGVISHLILDMLTVEGIWSIPATVLRSRKGTNPVKIRLVPKSRVFFTGGNWEGLVRIILSVVAILLLVLVVYDCLPYEIVFNNS